MTSEMYEKFKQLGLPKDIEYYEKYANETGVGIEHLYDWLKAGGDARNHALNSIDNFYADEPKKAEKYGQDHKQETTDPSEPSGKKVEDIYGRGFSYIDPITKNKTWYKWNESDENQLMLQFDRALDDGLISFPKELVNEYLARGDTVNEVFYDYIRDTFGNATAEKYKERREANIKQQQENLKENPIQNVIQKIGNAGNEINSTLDNIVKSMGEGSTLGMGGSASIVNNLFGNGFANGIKNILDGIVNWGAPIWDKIRNGLTNDTNLAMNEANNATNIQLTQETNAQNKAIADSNLAMQQGELDYQHALQKQVFEREDTSYQRTVNDMLQAGISPLAMSGMNGAGGVVSTTAPQNTHLNTAPTTEAGHVEMAGLTDMNIGTAMLQLEQEVAQIEQMDAQTELTRQQAVAMGTENYYNGEYPSKFARDKNFWSPDMSYESKQAKLAEYEVKKNDASHYEQNHFNLKGAIYQKLFDNQDKVQDTANKVKKGLYKMFGK